MDDGTEKRALLKKAGLALWAIGILYGILVCFYAFVLSPLGTRNPGAHFFGEFIGFFFAFIPAITVYIWVPRIIDRFEPEPWWTLAMAFFWGAIGAMGVAYTINTIMGIIGGEVGFAMGGRKAAELGSQILGASISAPIVEEGMKASFVLGMFLFLKNEFDGPVDGVVYAIFAALGFAMTENMLYYSRAIADSNGGGAFAYQFMLRGILKPWGHPFYTAITGLGIGIARETNKTWLKWVAPIGCYCVAVLFHMGWNTAGLVAGAVGVSQLASTFLMLFLYFLIMLCFLGLVVGLVVREARILRKNLADEVLLGNMTQGELDLLCSPIGRIKARMSKGGAGVDFLIAAAKLGMMKWHMVRAMEGKKMTMSAAEIVPLRQQMAQLKRQMGSNLALVANSSQPTAHG
jgi:RsiW-degrading membrane proteinase PrsW (M82 family)